MRIAEVRSGEALPPHSSEQQRRTATGVGSHGPARVLRPRTSMIPAFTVHVECIPGKLDLHSRWQVVEAGLVPGIVRAF